MDELGKTESVTYDSMGRPISSTNRVSATTSVSYDAMSRMLSQTGALGNVTDYEYNNRGWLTKVTYPDPNGTGSLSAPVTSYTYDSQELTVSTTQDGGSLDEQQSIGWSTTAFGMSGTYTITHNGQTTAAIAWNASAATIQTALEGLSSIGSGNISVTVTSPNTYSGTLSLTFRNGKGGTNVAQTTITTTGLMPVFSTVTPFNTTSLTFDTANRLTSIAHAQGSTTLGSYAYTYDGLSRIASINSSIDGLSTYAYDVSSQLTGADHSSQSDESYDYDDNGNRDSSGYTTSSNNRTTAAPGFTYTYDDEGNRTSRTDTNTGAVQETTWDYRNRLTKVVNRASSVGAITQQVDYEYDANNRMVKRALDTDGAGSASPTTQYWAYDQGINALLEFDGSSGSDLSHRYLWSSQVDELFADEQVTSPSTAGNTLWPLSDHLGSIRDIADMNESTSVATITNHCTMTATGAIVAETNAAVDLLFAFTGKQFDDATGLQHNLFRWYDSLLGSGSVKIRWKTPPAHGLLAESFGISKGSIQKLS